MADTIRDLSAILALLADNTAGDISPQDLRDAIVSQLLPIYGEMRVEAGVTAQGSLSSTPAKMTGWNTSGLSNGCTVDPTTDDDIEVLTAGVVYVEAHISFTGTASETFTFEIYKNGAQTGIAGIVPTNATPDAVQVSLAGRVTCAANDLFTIYVSTVGAASMTPTEAQFNVTRVK